MKARFGTRNLIDAGRSVPVMFVVGFSLIFYLAYDLVQFPNFFDLWSPTPRGDAGIMFDAAKQIFALRGYPPNGIFPYPPSAAIILRCLGIGGATGFAVVWYLLIVAALLLT